MKTHIRKHIDDVAGTIKFYCELVGFPTNGMGEFTTHTGNYGNYTCEAKFANCLRCKSNYADETRNLEDDARRKTAVIS